MILIITGAGHVGKTALAQKLMEKLHISYLSQDHIKMGLIRSGICNLSPESPDESLTEFLWPVTREIIKTAIENKQNLIIEGCYFPFSWKKDFDEEYLSEIQFICLCFSDAYIEEHYSDIIQYEDCIEYRVDDGYCTKELLKRENGRFRDGCRENNLNCVLIEKNYKEMIEDIVENRTSGPLSRFRTN